MKIDIKPEHLAALFRSGLIHPSDVRCLDQETKNLLKRLCLNLCQPVNCRHCDLQDQCGKSIDIKSPIPTTRDLSDVQ